VRTIVNPGAANETSGTIGANAVFGGNQYVQGPMRVGCFATGISTRESAGASYYGIMELSGNLMERMVPIYTGSAISTFDGSNGDGELASNGNNNVANWLTAIGNGQRGGAWDLSRRYLRVSDRTYYNTSWSSRNNDEGFRCVRSAQ
jgi:formylglycine-generating enzyme required for sulfatase activity